MAEQQQQLRAEDVDGGTDNTGNKGGKVFRRFHTTLVLRKFNQQWRIVVHDTATIKNSDFIGKCMKAKRKTKAGRAQGMFRDAIGKLLMSEHADDRPN